MIHIDIGWSASHTSSTICDSPWPLFLCVVKFVTLSKYKVISRILIRNSTKLHLFLIQRSWASSRVGDHLLLYFFSRLGITIPPCGQSPWCPQSSSQFQKYVTHNACPLQFTSALLPLLKDWKNPASNTPFSKYGHLIHHLSKQSTFSCKVSLVPRNQSSFFVLTCPAPRFSCTIKFEVSQTCFIATLCRGERQF